MMTAPLPHKMTRSNPWYGPPFEYRGTNSKKRGTRDQAPIPVYRKQPDWRKQGEKPRK